MLDLPFLDPNQTVDPDPGSRRPPGDRMRDVPTLEADVAGLHAALGALKRVYQFSDREQICCYDISVTQCWALDALRRRDSLTLNELAAELYLDKSTTSRVVTALEGKGYVRRSAHPDDGRSVVLEATPAGDRLATRIETEMLAQERRLLAEFDHEVRHSMVSLVGRLAAAAAARLDTSGGRCCMIE